MSECIFFYFLEFQDRVIFLLTDIRQLLQGNSNTFACEETVNGLEQLMSLIDFDALEAKIKLSREERQKVVGLVFLFVACTILSYCTTLLYCFFFAKIELKSPFTLLSFIFLPVSVQVCQLSPSSTILPRLQHYIAPGNVVSWA